jgi:hypothetical protein
VLSFTPGHLMRKDELALLDGLSSVANTLPPEQVIAATDRMLGPVQVRVRVRVLGLGWWCDYMYICAC